MNHQTRSTTNGADWTIGSACLDMDPDLFFPHGEGTRSLGQIAHARAICAECPVRAECLKFALFNNVEYGIWAGTTPKERAQLRRAADVRRNRRNLVVSRPSTTIDQREQNIPAEVTA